MASDTVFAPTQALLDRAAAAGIDVCDEKLAALLDEADTLKEFATQFHIPPRCALAPTAHVPA
jgi:hypothetical protein